MNVIPFVNEGLGNSSYLVGVDDTRAVAIDPDRSVDRYLRAAEARGWRIDAVLETHLHADFVSGVRELASQVGAKLFIPSGAKSMLQHHPVQAAERIALDGMVADAIASEGHTPEHLSYVIRGGAGPPVLFSGGSLIVGGAARTDLISPDATDALTRAQFRTLEHAFASLPDETLLCPTHGGGSFCSAGGGRERMSTLGAERASNEAMSIETEDEFARWFPTTFPAAPAYFFRMRAINQAGPRLRRDIKMPAPLSPDGFEDSVRAALIIDTRSVDLYSAAHIHGSLHIPFRDSFAVWLGWLVPADARLLFVAEPELIDAINGEALLVGYEDFGGWLEGGIDAWGLSGRPLSSIAYVGGDAARMAMSEGADVIDVREPDEVAVGHVPAARLMPLGSMPVQHLGDPKDRPVIVYCGHGERASTAASLLERAGRTRIINVRRGYDALVGETERAPTEGTARWRA